MFESGVIKGAVLDNDAHVWDVQRRAKFRDVVLITLGHAWAGCLVTVIASDEGGIKATLRCPPDIVNGDRMTVVNHGNYKIVGRI